VTKDRNTPSTIITTPSYVDNNLRRSSRVKKEQELDDSEYSSESEEVTTKGRGADHSKCKHEAGICVSQGKTKKKKTDKKLVFLSLRVYEKAKEH